MIHIPEDIYSQIADYIREQVTIERENNQFADAFCCIESVEICSHDDENVIVEVNGSATVYYRKSEEEWGTDYNDNGASIDIECATWDEYGEDIDNDFDSRMIEEYFQRR